MTGVRPSPRRTPGSRSLAADRRDPGFRRGDLVALAVILAVYVVANVAIVAARPTLMRQAVAAVDASLAGDRQRLGRGLAEWRAEMVRDGRWTAALLGTTPPNARDALRPVITAQVPSARVWLLAADGTAIATLADGPPNRLHVALARLSLARDSALLAATDARDHDLRIAVATPVRTASGVRIAVLDVSAATRLRPRLPDVAYEGREGRAALTFPFNGGFVGAAWAAGAREPEIHWPKNGWTLDDSSLIVVGGMLPDTTPRFQLGVPRAAAQATAEARAAWLHALAALVALPLCVGVLLAGRARREARLHDAELRAAEAEAATARAELAAVNARLDPHFLSNALHSVAALVDSDPAAAEDALDRLGDLFRYSLEQSERHTVTLGDEWQFVQDYLAIEQMRLGDRLTVRMELDPDVASLEVPSLLLQPLVENAVRHGVGPRREGGTVQVGARRAGDRVELVVSDDGVGADPQSLGSARGTGLRTLRQRLDLDARYDGRLAVRTAPGEGFQVRVSLNA